MLSNRASFDEYEEEKEYSWDETRDWQTVLSPVSESDGDVPPPPASDHSSCSTNSSPQTVVDCSSADDDSVNAAVDVGRVFTVDKSLKDRSSSVSGLYDFDFDDILLKGDLSSSSSSSSSIVGNTNQCLSRSLVVMRLFSVR